MLVNVHKSILSCNLMDDPEMDYMVSKLLFLRKDFDDGIKYLGFQIKLKDYRKEDWNWLLTKLGERLHIWSQRWLSHVGRLVLIKSVLETILVYWMSVS